VSRLLAAPVEEQIKKWTLRTELSAQEPCESAFIVKFTVADSDRWRRL
jgi:hypothetical protein